MTGAGDHCLTCVGNGACHRLESFARHDLVLLAAHGERAHAPARQVGAGIARIEKEGGSYWVVGTEDGPLAGKKVEIPGDNVAAIQWALEEEAKAAPKSAVSP